MDTLSLFRAKNIVLQEHSVQVQGGFGQYWDVGPENAQGLKLRESKGDRGGGMNLISTMGGLRNRME